MHVGAAAELTAGEVHGNLPLGRDDQPDHALRRRCLATADARPLARLVELGRRLGRWFGRGKVGAGGHHRLACSLVASPSAGAAGAGTFMLFLASARASSKTLDSFSRNDCAPCLMAR